jgi:hypothetical protein
MTYRTLAPRTLTSMRTPSLLSDIAEYSPNPDSEARTPSPQKPSIRSVSVASFLSDGTIEIEGFGFDNISEIGDDASVFGDSMYEGSVYDGQDDAERERERETDLSRRAERILANAKRKLDLCGQNISRARSSLILSPSATPTALMENLAAVGPAVRPRAESTGGARSLQWKYNNKQAASEERGPAHGRTASESAVQSVRGLGLDRSFGGLAGVPEEAEKTTGRGVSRSNSTQQMRALRDQMKDLRGKITSLQEQSSRDSIRRRQSISSMRSGESTPTAQRSPQAPTLEEIRESRVLNLDVSIEKQWEQQAAAQQRYSAATFDSDRSGTPKGPRREDINSPTFGCTEFRNSDAFSFDNYMYGETFLKGIRPDSISSNGTASTATTTLAIPSSRPHTLERKGSFVSISSYATADEQRSAPASPFVDEQLHAGTQLRPPAAWTANGSPRDDGYHSGPNTPRVDKDQPPVKQSSNLAPASSWYRGSMETFRTRSVMSEDGDREGGGVPLGISSSNRDSRTMIVAGMGIGGEEMVLRMGRNDRILVEGVIEALGRVCCAMEKEGERPRAELRDRLREAMRVLEGDDGEMF